MVCVFFTFAAATALGNPLNRWSLNERAAIEANNRIFFATLPKRSKADILKSAFSRSPSTIDQKSLKALAERWTPPSESLRFNPQGDRIWISWNDQPIASLQIHAASKDGLRVSWGGSSEIYSLRRGDVKRSFDRWLAAGLNARSGRRSASLSSAEALLFGRSLAQGSPESSQFRDILFLWSGETAYRDPLVSTASAELFRPAEVPSSDPGVRAHQPRIDIGRWMLPEGSGFFTRTGRELRDLFFSHPPIECRGDGRAVLSGQYPQDGSSEKISFDLIAEPDGAVLVTAGNRTIRLGPKRTARRGDRGQVQRMIQEGCNTRPLRSRMARAPQRPIDEVELRDLHGQLSGSFRRLCQSLVVQDRAGVATRPIPGRPDCEIPLQGGTPTAQSLEAWVGEFERRCQATLDLVEQLPLGWSRPSTEICLPAAEGDEPSGTSESSEPAQGGLCPSGEEASPEGLALAFGVRPRDQLQRDYEELAKAEKDFMERVNPGRFILRNRAGLADVEPAPGAWPNLTSAERSEFNRHSNAVSGTQSRVLQAEGRALSMANQLYMLGAGLQGCCGSQACREDVYKATGRRLTAPSGPTPPAAAPARSGQ